jgi:hypothetical protein
MVPVRAVDHHFVFQFRIGARHHGRHVELFNLAHGGLHLAIQLGGQRHRLEVLLGRSAQRIQVLTGP